MLGGRGVRGVVGLFYSEQSNKLMAHDTTLQSRVNQNRGMYQE